MDPFTIAALAGAGIGAIGKLMSGVSSSAMDALQSQIYGINAGISSENADALAGQAKVDADQGNLNVSRIQTQGAETLAKQRNFFTSSNVDPTYGSPLLTMARTAGRVASDVDIARASAAISSANDLTQSAGQRGQALSSLLNQQGANMKSSSDMMAGVFGAASSLLTGVGAAGKIGGSNVSTISVGSQSFPAFT